jgi:methylase of polypeptide subunit release factors
MKLVPTENNKWGRPEEADYLEYRLNSGIVLAYDGHLDCGGILTHVEFAEIVKTSNRTYNRGFEWCIGLGAIGFELLGQKICKNLSGNDYYGKAIESCKETAKRNNLIDNFRGHVSSTISGIIDDKWDLVVGNPPHCWTFEEVSVEHVPDHMKDNIQRCLVDDNMEIHAEFFKNIRSKLTDDADVFLSEADTSPDTTAKILEMAKAGGLTYVKTFPFPKLFSAAAIHLFKPN